jgi:hypothetical protein
MLSQKETTDMHPLALALTAAAVGGGLYLYGKSKEQQAQALPTAIVSKLTKGKKYAVLAVITKNITDDPRWNGAGATNEQKIQNLIASTFEQSGCLMLSRPAIRDEVEMQKANAGEPSTWVFNMQWMLDATYIERVIPWLSNALFIQLPTA